MKKCIKCGEEKELEKFASNKLSKDEKCNYCKDCTNAITKAWGKKNPDKLKIIRHKTYLKIKDEHIKDTNRRNKKRDGGLYSTYWAMIRRCKYPSQKGYKWYGAKGITVEWKSYHEFREDMYESFVEHVATKGRRNTTIDRLDSSKNYCKENCRWTDYKGQAESKKNKQSSV